MKKIKKRSTNIWVIVCILSIGILGFTRTRQAVEEFVKENERRIDGIGIQTVNSNAVEIPILMAESSILMDIQGKRILYEKKIHEKKFPASTTKIMTALLAIERGKLQDMVTITNLKGCYTSGSKLANFQEGDILTLEQLLYALLVYSANDGAAAIAQHIAGSQERFAEMMTERAKELGAQNTQFKNSHGLHDEGHYTTAYDLALIASEAAKHEIFMKIVSTPSYKAVFKNNKGQTLVREWNHTNQFLKGNNNPFSDIELGGKTGFTNQAGYNLVSFAGSGENQFISVVLKDGQKEVYKDTEKLIQYAFAQQEVFLETNQTSMRGQIYRVRKGDTLYQISRKFYGTDQMMEKIMALNQIQDLNKIWIGQEIKLP